MADVFIDSTPVAQMYAFHLRAGIIYVDDTALTGYTFYNDVGGGSGFGYRKTTDGGATWGAFVVIDATNVAKSDVWFDQETPGILTNLIHIFSIRIVGGGYTVRHQSLDPATDTLSAVHTAVTSASAAASTDWTNSIVSGTKDREGNLFLAYWRDAIGERGTLRSIDNGVSWVVINQVADGDLVDGIMLMPGGETEIRDVVCVYHDYSSQEMTKKTYDQSLGTWSEGAAFATGINHNFANWIQFDCAQRRTDNAIIVTAATLLGAGASDLEAYAVLGGAVVTTLTDVFSAETDHGVARVLVDQSNDDLFVAYIGDPGDTYPGTVNIRWKSSSDDGVTWSAATIFPQFAADSKAGLWLAGNVGNSGGRFQPCWFVDVSGGTDFLTNFENSFALAATPPPTPPTPPANTANLCPVIGSSELTEFLSYISPDGIEYPFNTPHTFGRFLLNFSGYGTPPIEYVTQRAPFQHGVTVKDFFLQPRVIQLLIRQGFRNRPEWWDGRADLLNQIRPNRQLTATGVVPGQLRLITANNDVRDLNVFITEGPRFEPRILGTWDEWAFQEVLRFIAHDPVLFDPTQVIASFTITVDEHLVFPITFPIQFGNGVIDDSLNITYLGTWFAFPVIVITGRIDDPIIENLTTGEKIQMDLNIPNGRTITIDLTEGVKTVVDDLGTNLIGTVSSDSDLATFHIAADPEAAGGVNAMRLRGSNASGNTSVQIRYFVRYFGV